MQNDGISGSTGNCAERGGICLRKKIGYISLDSGLAKWLCEKLRVPGRTAPEREELAEALEELMSGSVSSLMLELDGAPVTQVADSCLQFGALSVDPRLRRVSRNGVEISLTPKEFDILWFLARNCGEVFTKKQIYQAVWEEDYMMDDSNIMAFIRKLRKKIEPDPDAPEYILTIWGIGYKFNDRFPE